MFHIIEWSGISTPNVYNPLVSLSRAIAKTHENKTWHFVDYCAYHLFHFTGSCSGALRMQNILGTLNHPFEHLP